MEQRMTTKENLQILVSFDSFQDESRAVKIAHKIQTWDCENVQDIRSWIHDFKRVSNSMIKEGYINIPLNENGEYFEIDALPTKKKFGDIIGKPDHEASPQGVHYLSDYSTYPAWCMDRHGMCLVGESLDEIMHIHDLFLQQRHSW